MKQQNSNVESNNTKNAIVKTYDVKGYGLQVHNKDFANNLNKMLLALKDIECATWKHAYAVYEIVVEKQYSKDFSSKERMATALNMSKTQMTRELEAVDFVSNTDNIDRNAYGIDRCAILNRVRKDGTFNEFIQALKDNGYITNSVLELSTKELVKFVSAWCEKQQTTAGGQTNEEETTNKLEKEEETKTIVIDGITYIIPVKVLNKYMVKQ